MAPVEFIEIGLIGVSALIMAIDESIRRTEHLRAWMPKFLLSGAWRFFPAVLFCTAAILFISDKIGYPILGYSLGGVFFFVALGGIWSLARSDRAIRSPPIRRAPINGAIIEANKPILTEISAPHRDAISAWHSSAPDQLFVPQDIYFHHDTVTPDLGFRHKLWIVLRNQSGRDIIVNPASWERTSGDISLICRYHGIRGRRKVRADGRTVAGVGRGGSERWTRCM
jgi:hypothetical protein